MVPRPLHLIPLSVLGTSCHGCKLGVCCECGCGVYCWVPKSISQTVKPNAMRPLGKRQRLLMEC
jgi:hypothetical protein